MEKDSITIKAKIPVLEIILEKGEKINNQELFSLIEQLRDYYKWWS